MVLSDGNLRGMYCQVEFFAFADDKPRLQVGFKYRGFQIFNIRGKSYVAVALVDLSYFGKIDLWGDQGILFIDYIERQVKKQCNASRPYHLFSANHHLGFCSFLTKLNFLMAWVLI